MPDTYQSSPGTSQALLPVRGMIEGFRVSADGTVTPVEDPSKEKAPRGGFIWLHLNIEEAGELIESDLGLDPMVARSLLAQETRPRCQHLRSGVLINLRGVNLNEGARPEDMISIRCWLEAQRLITVRMRRSVAVEELRELYRAGQAHERPGQLLVEIIRRLLSLIEPVVDGLADSLDSLEELADKVGESDALEDQISSMRHDAATYRRYLGPMRDAIVKLGSRETGGLNADDILEIQEEADRATRIVEELDITIERANVIVDQMAAARSDRMNRNMMVLSVVSAIFLPLGFLTGLLGINVGGVPGADNPYAFWIVVAICLFCGLVAGAYFKARDWI
ncbi:zinc transporter ZntB [Parvularcula lutaonensis]|uniref:Zinc transporter ZntB n=1 Tax=Parvularcula lutaonensis TaxID=491923 RepID=A0ABV7M9Y9_9PROT|nr:zinc transporter ZntB [Parvularcula lutaonensis]GGY47549.1 transporter [Parvularcula lutaonensis]